MTKKDIDCLNKLYNYLLNNNFEISEEELNIALDIYIFYQTALYKKNKNLIISSDDFNKFKFLNGKYGSAFEDTRLLVNDLLNKRFDEVYNFLNIYLSDNSYYRKEVLLYDNIPFKGTNIDVERVIFAKMFSDPLILESYRTLINDILFCMRKNVYNNISEDNIMSIDSWLFYSNIFYSSFRKDDTNFDQLRINNKRVYGDDDMIRNTFLYNPYDTYSVGNYAELVVFKLQKKYLIASGRPDLAARVKWVARDVGDGFGYDILSFDPITSKEILIEAKGTYKKKNEYIFVLTNKEKILFDNSILYPTENIRYYVYHVYLDKFNKDDIYPVSIVEYVKDSNNELIPVNQCGKEYEILEDPKNPIVENYKKKYWFKGK